MCFNGIIVIMCLTKMRKYFFVFYVGGGRRIKLTNKRYNHKNDRHNPGQIDICLWLFRGVSINCVHGFMT